MSVALEDKLQIVQHDLESCLKVALGPRRFSFKLKATSVTNEVIVFGTLALVINDETISVALSQYVRCAVKDVLDYKSGYDPYPSMLYEKISRAIEHTLIGCVLHDVRGEFPDLEISNACWDTRYQCWIVQCHGKTEEIASDLCSCGLKTFEADGATWEDPKNLDRLREQLRDFAKRCMVAKADKATSALAQVPVGDTTDGGPFMVPVGQCAWGSFPTAEEMEKTAREIYDRFKANGYLGLDDKKEEPLPTPEVGSHFVRPDVYRVAPCPKCGSLSGCMHPRPEPPCLHPDMQIVQPTAWPDFIIGGLEAPRAPNDELWACPGCGHFEWRMTSMPSETPYGYSVTGGIEREPEPPTAASRRIRVLLGNAPTGTRLYLYEAHPGSSVLVDDVLVDDATTRAGQGEVVFAGLKRNTPYSLNANPRHPDFNLATYEVTTGPLDVFDVPIGLHFVPRG